MSKTENQRRARELVMRYYTAYNAANWRACLSLLSPNVIHEHPGGRESGRLSFEQFATRADRIRLQFADISVCASQNGLQAAARYAIVGSRFNIVSENFKGSTPSRPLQGRSFFDIEAEVIARIATYVGRRGQLNQRSG